MQVCTVWQLESLFVNLSMHKTIFYLHFILKIYSTYSASSGPLKSTLGVSCNTAEMFIKFAYILKSEEQCLICRDKTKTKIMMPYAATSEATQTKVKSTRGTKFSKISSMKIYARVSQLSTPDDKEFAKTKSIQPNTLHQGARTAYTL